MILSAIIHKEDDMYVAECPEVGTVSQGSSIEEALANLKEATELYLEEFPIKDKKQLILTTTFGVYTQGDKIAKV
ncbi:type II toxin-antitoxin system HicB family antitoxin [Methanothermococcus sp.]|uniref:type II toxin-antitoxin system HicB family antitoxin n=1 Tax=Methanothermococcus sp. TaxID=2614238 RepID=UPI0025E972A7|nr:type II toxin-antitoxin system HicB family antitoxin [Methanothermococcus sp.]